MKSIKMFISAVLAAVMFSACAAGNGSSFDTADVAEPEPQLIQYQYDHELNIIDDNYRNYYEVFLYSYCDSNGDGIGDINGLISKLDYINDMGFNGIWLMPVMQSTTYHKYDVIDYYTVDKEYGTNEDFINLADECHKRGIKLIIDMVINHTSVQNEWFKSACQSLKHENCGQEQCIYKDLCPQHNPYCSYYNFTDEKPTSNDWYSVSGTDYYYEGIFWDQMPDLNLDNEQVWNELEKIASYWLIDMKCDGFRLDAAKEYFSGDTDKNVAVLKRFCDYCKSIKSDCYNVAEVWDSFTLYTKYYDSGIDSVFGFTLAQEDGKIVKTLNSSGTNNSAKSFAEAQALISKVIHSNNKNAIDAPFLTNHDTARAAGYFSGDSDKIKMAAGMILTMQGSPFVYYGEEIGMSGSGKHENIRTPMLWSNENSNGMTNGPKDAVIQPSAFEAVDKQLDDPASILNYYKRALRIRNENPEIARGSVTEIALENADTCAVKRNYNGSSLTIVYNFSHETLNLTDAALELDKNDIRGYLTVSPYEEITLENGILKMPKYSIVILKEGE